MNKKIFIFFIFSLFLTGILPNIYGNDFSDQLDQYMTEGGWSFSTGLDGYPYMAQSFRPTLNTLTRILLCIDRSPSESGSVTISIRSSLDESDLTSITVDSGDLPYPSPDWMEFDVPDISVAPEELYYIVVIPNNSRYGMAYPGPNADLYLRGEAWVYDIDHGWSFASEIEYNISDFCFKQFGNNDGPKILDINNITGGFRASAIIKNSGTSTANDVSWSIELDGGLILQGGFSDGIIDELPAGESKTIRLQSLFGIGPTKITVTVGDVSKQASGFILGPLVLNVREI